MALTEEMKQRMNMAWNYWESNCIGTALYVLGMRKDDRYLYPSQQNLVEQYLSCMEKIESAKPGCAFALRHEDGTVRHMGIVIESAPVVKVFHRVRTNGDARIGDDIGKVSEGYFNCEIEYYKTPETRAASAR